MAEPEDADRELVDLLFFPTGGGKTEAYLGSRLSRCSFAGCGILVRSAVAALP